MITGRYTYTIELHCDTCQHQDTRQTFTAKTYALARRNATKASWLISPGGSQAQCPRCTAGRGIIGGGAKVINLPRDHTSPAPG